MIDIESLRAHVSGVLSIPLSELNDNTLLDSSGNWDSLAKIGVVAMIFENSKITVSQDEIDEIETLVDILKLVERKTLDSSK